MLKTKKFWISTLCWALALVGASFLIDYAVGSFTASPGYFAKIVTRAFLLSFVTTLFVFKPKPIGNKNST